MITTTITEGTVTGQSLEVSHPGQGGQGGATRQVPPLFEGGAIPQVCPPGQGRDPEGVIQEGVVVIPNTSIRDQEARV